MKLTRYILIVFVSAFVNFNASAAPTHVTELSINAQEDIPTGIAFNSDGTKMFIVGIAGDDINEYSISVAYDLSSTVTHLDRLPTTGSTTPQDLAFNANGTEVFIVDTGGNLLS